MPLGSILCRFVSVLHLLCSRRGFFCCAFVSNIKIHASVNPRYAFRNMHSSVCVAKVHSVNHFGRFYIVVCVFYTPGVYVYAIVSMRNCIKHLARHVYLPVGVFLVQALDVYVCVALIHCMTWVTFSLFCAHSTRAVCVYGFVSLRFYTQHLSTHICLPLVCFAS